MAGGTTAPGAAIGSATTSARDIAALGHGLPAVAHGRRSRRARFLRRLLGVSLTAVVVALFGGAGSAAAGTYSVYADCNNNQAWTAKSGARGNLVAYTDCNASAIPAGMKMYVPPQNDDRHFNNAGDTASFTFSAPTGTRIFGIDWHGTAFEGASSFCWGATVCSKEAWNYNSALLADNPFRFVGLRCAPDNIGTCATVSGPSLRGKDVGGFVGGLNEGGLAFFVACSDATCPAQTDDDAGHFYSRAWLAVA